MSEYKSTVSFNLPPEYIDGIEETVAIQPNGVYLPQAVPANPQVYIEPTGGPIPTARSFLGGQVRGYSYVKDIKWVDEYLNQPKEVKEPDPPKYREYLDSDLYGEC